MKNITKAITVFLAILFIVAPMQRVFADAYYEDIPSGYGSGYSDFSSFYGSGYTDVPSTYGSGYTDVPSTYGSGYTNIPSTYGSGYSDLSSFYGSGYTNIPSTYSSGYTDIPSTYGSGYTDIPSTYGSGYTNIPSTYGSGYTDIPSVYGDSGYTTVSYPSPIYTTPTYPTVTPTYVPTYTQPTYTNTYPTYTQPTYTSPTYTQPTYTNPVYPTYVQPTYTPSVTTIPVTTTAICADGQAPINGSCVRTTTIPVTTTTRCADGTLPNPLTGCTRTNVIPTQTNTVCSDGSYPVNGSCIRTVVAPTVTYQSCWDGSTIPLGSVCPAQYKTCPNGTSIPVNQTCYYSPTVPYTPPQEIKFNNVITSVATEITKTSARCNGIGLIASGALSTGWFEYGETPNLGRETGKANIGSSATAPFSNVLANLKPSTTYYCRAVMQNQFGTVKGEVVAFTTKSTAVTYVKPVVTTKTTTKVTKTTDYKASYAPKNEVACVDGTTVKLESKTTAQLLNSGQKLITLQIEKVGGDLSAGSAVSYKLTWKNLSDEALRGVAVKVTVPAEITLTNASAGKFDPVTRTLTIDQSVLAPYSEGSVTWSGVVARETQAGKSLATTAYSSYSVPGTNVQDEVTAYSVASVVPGTALGTSTAGAKTVVGATSDRGFLPNTLVEWLALIAIIFIIVVLGRSVYTSYTAEKKVVVHH